MVRFEYLEPTSLEEALSLLAKHGQQVKVLAGGTDLINSLKERALRPRYVLNIKRIPGLDNISYSSDDGLKVGTLSTIGSLETSAIVKEKYSALAEAAHYLGSPQVRNLATIGGNICNAAPSAETASPLLALSATARIASVEGERVLPLESFFTGPGRIALNSNELLVELQLPQPTKGVGMAYIKYSPRRFMDVAVVGAAVVLAVEKEKVTHCRIALGAVAPTPVRAHKAESLLVGQKLSESLLDNAALEASKEINPISDIRASAKHRREMVKVHVARGLRLALKRAGWSIEEAC